MPGHGVPLPVDRSGLLAFPGLPTPERATAAFLLCAHTAAPCDAARSLLRGTPTPSGAFLLGYGVGRVRRVDWLRGLLFAADTSYPALLIGQCLGGISAAAVTVLTALMVADMTTGTGRF